VAPKRGRGEKGGGKSPCRMQSRQNGDEDKPRGGPLLASQLHSLTAGKAGGKSRGKAGGKS